MTNQRIRLTKQLLSNALIDLLQRKKISKITIQELSNEAGINRSTFYLHYSDVYDLLDEIEDTLINDVKNYLHSKDSSTSYIEHLLNYIYENKVIFKTLLGFCEESRFNNEFLQLSRNLLLNDIFGDRQLEHGEYIIEYLVRGNNALTLKWISNDFDISVKDLTNIMTKLSQNTLYRNSL